MQSHAAFSGLLLHTDDELATLLGVRIVDRRTIHEWPLSCVQRVALEDGRMLIYKSQRPPSVEAAFYERAASPLLPGHRLLGTLGDCETMTLDWIDAPLLSAIATRDTEMVEHGRRVIDAIAGIRGDLPVYLDVGTIEKWTANARVTLEKLRALVMDRRFEAITLETVDAVEAWSTNTTVLDAVTANPRVTHGDLKGDQVFVTPTAATGASAGAGADVRARANAYRVIDWQRPIIAPPDTDLVALLVEQRMRPYGFVDITIVRIFWFLRLSWAVEAQFDLFPDFTTGPFQRWALRAATGILA
jgi:hypothetical protein